MIGIKLKMKTLKNLEEYIYLDFYQKKKTVWNKLLTRTVREYLPCVNFNFLNINNEIEKLFI